MSSEKVMAGKVCLVTGATTGIGKETARELARLGATVMLVGRDARKAERAVEEIRRETGNGQVSALLADLSRLDEVRRLAADFRARHDRLDVLVNNAGAIYDPRQLTADGLEMTFAVNHLAYFLLTRLLQDLLVAAAPSRVVVVASDAHYGGRVDLGDLQCARGYTAMGAYCGSKLMNVLFAYELARRLQGTGVDVNALNPGTVASNFGQSGSWWLRWGYKLFGWVMLSPAQGARTSVYLASAPEVAGVSGKYFSSCRQKRSVAASYDEALARGLWEISERLTGLAPAG